MKTDTMIKAAPKTVKAVAKKDHCAYEPKNCDHSCPACRFGGDSGMM